MQAQTAEPATARRAAAGRYFLPPGYVEQTRNLTLDVNRDNGSYWSQWRLDDSGRYEVHVYRWAARLVRERGLRSVLDIGCGVGTKLAAHLAPVCTDIHALDQASALEHVARQCPSAARTEVDLEVSDARLGRTFDLILCADVIEHLVDPDPMVEMVKAHARRAGGQERSGDSEATLVLFSTPERRRLRGRACNGSSKPEHVREWGMDEFRRFLSSRGFVGLRSRLFPQDDTDPRAYRDEEIAWRLGRGEKSRLACHAVLCRVG